MGELSGDIWRYGKTLSAVDKNSGTERYFRGFIEQKELSGPSYSLKRVGSVSNERFKLISEPRESFTEGPGMTIACEGFEFVLISSVEVYAGKELSHRESVLRRAYNDD